MEIDIWCADVMRHSRLRRAAPPDWVSRVHSTLAGLRQRIDQTYDGVVLLDLSSQTTEAVLPFVRHLTEHYPHLPIVAYYDMDGSQAPPEDILEHIRQVASAEIAHIIVNDINEDASRVQPMLARFSDPHRS